MYLQRLKLSHDRVWPPTQIHAKPNSTISDPYKDINNQPPLSSHDTTQPSAQTQPKSTERTSKVQVNCPASLHTFTLKSTRDGLRNVPTRSIRTPSDGVRT